MRWLIGLLVLGCAASVSPSAEVMEVRVDPARSVVKFTVGGTAHTIHGTFAVKSGVVRVSADGAASGEVVVDVRSGSSGYGARDRRMHGEILESAKYPEAVMRFERVVGKGPDVMVSGTLTLHGASHAVEMPARALVGTGGKVTASAKFIVPYVQWGMKNPSVLFLKVSDKAELEIELVSQ